MNRFETKANGLKNEIKFMKLFVKEIRKAVSIMDTFDNKVYNARFDNYIKENTMLSVGSRGMYSFTINMYDYSENGFRKTLTENVVYDFYDIYGKNERTRIYNKETDLNDKFVNLFKEDDKTRMHIQGWKELFESTADLVENRIKRYAKFTNAEKIFKASQKELAIQEQIRELENKRLKTMPNFLR